MNAEQSRLDEAGTRKAPWKKWGPYLSEPQWGIVREDCSEGTMPRIASGTTLPLANGEKTAWLAIRMKDRYVYGVRCAVGTQSGQSTNRGRKA